MLNKIESIVQLGTRFKSAFLNREDDALKCLDKMDEGQYFRSHGTKKEPAIRAEIDQFIHANLQLIQIAKISRDDEEGNEYSIAMQKMEKDENVQKAIQKIIQIDAIQSGSIDIEKLMESKFWGIE